MTSTPWCPGNVGNQIDCLRYHLNPKQLRTDKKKRKRVLRELKGADSICEPGSMLLKEGKEDGYDSCLEGTYGGATLSQKIGNHSSLWEG
ncbi:hypothetical protein QTP88_006408 [Uroleucon formosanum]